MNQTLKQRDMLRKMAIQDPKEILREFPLDEKTKKRMEQEIEAQNANLAWGVASVASVLSMLLAFNAVALRDENVDLRERMAGMVQESESRKLYDDSWVCSFERSEKRKALVKHCIRSEGD